MSPGTRPEAAPAPAPPLSYGRQELDEDDERAVLRVLRAARGGAYLTQGPEVARFERGLCEVTGAPAAVAVSHGTAALELAYQGLGLGPGDLVLTTPNTFLATATTALRVGARVEFVDVEPRGANLDLDLLEARLVAGPTPAAVAVVPFAGLPLDMERVLALKRRFGFLLLEDAAHALGASYVEGGRTWRVGEHPEVDATCLSFHPVKHVTTAEGGAVLTHDLERARRLRRLRSHGVERETEHRPFQDTAGPSTAGPSTPGQSTPGPSTAGQSTPGPAPPWFAPMVELGVNARLSDLAAALGCSQLEKLDRFLARRRALAARYLDRLSERRDVTPLDPGEPAGLGRLHAWHLFCVHVDAARRDRVMARLRDQGVHTQLHYYPVPYQPWFQERFGLQRFPVAEAHARRAISLPLYPGLTDELQDRVLDALDQALAT